MNKLSTHPHKSKTSKRNKLIAILAALIVMGIGYALIASRAAGPFASVTANNTTLSGNATFTTDTDGSKVISFNAPVTTPPPTPPPTTPPVGGLKGWQLTTTNVGLAPHGLNCDVLVYNNPNNPSDPLNGKNTPGGGRLPFYEGSLKPAAGTTIYRQLIRGPLDLSNGNITIDQSCVRPTSTGYHNAFLVTTTVCSGNSCSATATGNVIVRDSEITAEQLSASSIAASCAFLGVGTVQRNYMHGMGSGICFFETGTAHNALAEGNYVRGLRSAGDSHNEAATIRDFRKNAGDTRTVKFINNRLDCSSGNETGGLFIQPTWSPIYNVTIQGNYIEGGGYNLYLEQTGNASYGNVRAIDNRMRSTGWGPAVTSSGPGYTEWRDNYRYDASKTDGKGAVVNP